MNCLQNDDVLVQAGFSPCLNKISWMQDSYFPAL